MSGAKRCDEILRLIDVVLADTKSPTVAVPPVGRPKASARAAGMGGVS
jgi:hypothetical protein